MSRACVPCMRRSALIGHLAPRIASLLDRPGRARAREVLALSEPDLIAAVAGRRAQAARRLLEDFDGARAYADLEQRGLSALCTHCDGYPAKLLGLSDAPAVLYIAGDSGALAAEPMACVVGARRASSYALEVAHELGRGLASAGVTVVSGLALGIDAAAHRGALAGTGPTVAVLASGVDRPYPRTNRVLYERVRERGVAVSEMPPGQPAFRWSFPARNRIMAGLCTMTVVVEAGDPSGSLITAHFALDLGRDVGAVPGWVTSRKAAGSNRLLREGASVVRGVDDVLDDLYGVGAGARPRGALSSPPLEPTLRRVLDGVEAGEGAEAIGRSAGVSAAAARAALGRLESLGFVSRDGLGSYQRAVGQ